MKIMITAPRHQPYSGSLVLRLMQQLAGEIILVIVEPSLWQRSVAYWRNYGLTRFINRTIHLPRSQEIGEHYFAQYIQQHRLGDSELPLFRLAKRYGLPCWRVRSLNHPIVARLARECDLVINTGGGIFRLPLIVAPRHGIINAHRGQLPEFRGMSPLVWMALARQFPPSITTHLIAPRIDEGDIILRRTLALDPTDITIVRWQDKALATGVELLLETVALVRTGRAQYVPQSHADGRQHYVIHPRLRQIAERYAAEWVESYFTSASPSTARE